MNGKEQGWYPQDPFIIKIKCSLFEKVSLVVRILNQLVDRILSVNLDLFLTLRIIAYL